MKTALKFWFGGLMATALATCALPSLGQIPPPPIATSGTLGAANAVVNLTLGGQATCGADISGTWSGTITFQVAGQSQNYQSAGAFTYGGTSAGSSTTSNGDFAWAIGGQAYCQVKMTTYTSGTANVTLQAVPGSTVTLSSTNGGGSSNVSVVNTPGVTVQNTPGFVCISGCGGTGNVTVVAPTNAAGQVIVTTPAPTYTANQTVTVNNTPGVTVQNTPAVNVNNTPAVNVNNTPAVNVQNTPAVTFASVAQPVNVASPMCNSGSNVCVTTPAPAPTNVSDSGINVHTVNSYGYATASASSTNITTATTTLILAGSTTNYTIVYFIGAVTTGTNAAPSNSQFVTGATTTTPCDTSQVSWMAQSIANNASGSNTAILYGSGGPGNGALGFSPATIPFVIPPTTPATNLCLTTTGTGTISVKGEALYSTRAYAW